MAKRDLRGITTQDAEIAVRGRVIAFTSFTMSHTRNKGKQSAIGAEITIIQGTATKNWNGDVVLTREDWVVLNQVMEDEGVFDITCRIPTGENTYDNILLQGCELDEDTMNLQGDGASNVTLSGTYNTRKRTG